MIVRVHTKWVAVCDLGLSAVFIYELDTVNGALVGAADDPRHMRYVTYSDFSTHVHRVRIHLADLTVVLLLRVAAGWTPGPGADTQCGQQTATRCLSTMSSTAL